MKNEALEKIKEALTPTITVVSCQDLHDDLDGCILGELRYSFKLPIGFGLPPITLGKTVTFMADKDGNILHHAGLF